jgi:hypothetical protein
MILASHPVEVAREEGAVNKGGGLKDPQFYKRDCTAGSPAPTTSTSRARRWPRRMPPASLALIIQAHGTP